MLEIITVTKNDKDGFIKTINSTRFLRENFNISHIIVDGSDKGIRNEIKTMSRNEKNILYYWQNPIGISAAFNYGLKFVKSKWIWFLNGGDVINQNIDLNNFLNILNNSTADAIIFQIQYMQSGEILNHPPLWSLWPPILSWIPHPATVVKMDLFKKYGNFDKSLKIAMDYELWLRFFINNVIVDLISIPIVNFDQNGLAFALNYKTKAEVRHILRKYFWQILKKWFWQLRIIAKAFIINSLFFRNKIK